MNPQNAEKSFTALQDLIDWQAAEIERLKDLVREQDRLKGTTTARLSLTPSMIVVTCPTVDERKVATFLFAGVAQWMQCTAFATLEKHLATGEAARLVEQAWDDPFPTPAADAPAPPEDAPR